MKNKNNFAISYALIHSHNTVTLSLYTTFDMMRLNRFLFCFSANFFFTFLIVLSSKFRLILRFYNSLEFVIKIFEHFQQFYDHRTSSIYPPLKYLFN